MLADHWTPPYRAQPPVTEPAVRAAVTLGCARASRGSSAGPPHPPAGLSLPSHAVSPAGTTLHLAVAGTPLRGWEVNPGRPRGLVYFGGNGEAVQHLRPELERRFPDHTCYLLAYRGYGASEGRPSERALVGDALALMDHVATRHPDAPWT